MNRFARLSSITGSNLLRRCVQGRDWGLCYRSICAHSSTAKEERPSCNPRDSEEFSKLSSIFIPQIENFIAQNDDPNVPPVIYANAKDILSKLLTMNDISENGCTLGQLNEQIETILKYSVRTTKGSFVDKLYSGSDAIGQLSTLLLSVLNTNVHVFGAAPVLTCIEYSIIQQLCKIFFKLDANSDNSNFGGIFAPGGSYSNMLSIKLARDKYFPENITDGLANCKQTPVMLVSDQLHYSTMTGAGAMGIGSNNVIKIKSNTDGTINTAECERVLEDIKLNKAHLRPFYINGMAGTTVFGAFDNFAEISRIAKKYDMWFHIDGCWGGASALCNNVVANTANTANNNANSGVANETLSEEDIERAQQLSDLMKNSELADSIAWDAHKCISVPLLCSILLVQNENYLRTSCLPPNAAYLFHGNSMDIGQKTLQCGRQGDSLKLYLSWLYYGQTGMAKRVMFGLKNARYLADALVKSDDFILVQYPSYANVCFYYVPQSMTQEMKEWTESGFAYNEGLFKKLDEMTKKIHAQMRAKGRMCIDYSPVPAHQLPTFFRAITSNYRLEDGLLDQILTDVRDSANELNIV